MRIVWPRWPSIMSSESRAKLVKKIENRDALIGVVGLGYVGQPLLLNFAEEGFKVVGFDISSQRVEQLNAGQSSIEHIADDRIKQAVARGARFTTQLNYAVDADVLILCLPTPLNKHREPDLSFVRQTLDALTPFLRACQAIILESTTYPGTTEEEVVSRVSSIGLEVGTEIFVIYSPERENPGNKEFDSRSIPKIVSGHTQNCLAIAESLYGIIVDRVVPVTSTRVAELTKLLENIHRAVNVGLVNEMKLVADKMDIDIFEVIDAAATKPFGFTPYYPGPGLGGHCIPIDPFYLTWKAKEFGVDTRFIELAGEVNRAMPRFVVDKLRALCADIGMGLEGLKVLVLGIAYKKNVDDVRESPAVAVMELLRDAGASVSYSDPHVPSFPIMRDFSFSLSSVDLTSTTVADFDVVVLTTDHDAFDFEMIKLHAKHIVDTRGVYDRSLANITRA